MVPVRSRRIVGCVRVFVVVGSTGEVVAGVSGLMLMHLNWWVRNNRLSTPRRRTGVEAMASGSRSSMVKTNRSRGGLATVLPPWFLGNTLLGAFLRAVVPLSRLAVRFWFRIRVVMCGLAMLWGTACPLVLEGLEGLDAVFGISTIRGGQYGA